MSKTNDNGAKVDVPTTNENNANAPVDKPTSKDEKTRKLRSVVWLDFSKEKNAKGEPVAKCTHCNKYLTAKGKSGTSHLKAHLESCFQYKRAKRRKVDVYQQLLKVGEKKEDGTTNIECFEFDQELSRDDLTRMVIYHEYPFSMVDHILFRTFAKNLQPQFKLITRNTLKADCLKMYENEKNKEYKVLDNLSCRVSLTSDMWTSECMDGYLCLTCHYIDNDWKLQKRILNFQNVEAPHTGEVISKVIIEKLYDWNIDAKIFSITLDNCESGNDVVSREMMKILSNKNALLVDGKLFQVRCCAHILNLVVQDDLNSIREVIHNIRESIKFVKSSQSRLERFRKIIKQVKAPQRSLFYDVSTRWNSTYLMLENALLFKDAFARMAECDHKYTCAPTELEWSNVRIVVDCLKLFYEVTKRISGTKYTTSNIYFNDVCDVYISILSWNESPYPFIRAMAEPMREKFEKYWGIASMVLAIASIMDPRFKLKSVEYFFKRIYREEVEFQRNVANIKDALACLYNDYVNVPNNQAQSIQGSSYYGSNMSASTPSQPSSSYMSSSSSRLELARFIQESVSNDPKKSELDTYLDDPVHPGINDESFDILFWWKVNCAKYPIVSQMARDVLAAPVSTVASESAFSTGGRVLDEYRSSLKPETAQTLICTQDWIRAQINDSQICRATDLFSTIRLAPKCDGEYDSRMVLPTDQDESHHS